MLDKKVVKLLNEQVNAEFYSAYLYLDFANYYADEGLDGFQNWELASGSVATPRSPIEAPRASGVMLMEVTPVVMGLNSVSLMSLWAHAGRATATVAKATMHDFIILIIG